MAEYSRFFGGANEYTQPQFAEVMARLLKNGVIPDVGGELAVTESDPAAMSVVVAEGQSWIEGHWHKNDVAKTVAIPTANAENPRIDRIVLRLDTITNLKISIEVLQGTAEASPTAPALTRTSQAYELSLAQVYVGAGVTSVTTTNITDERFKSELCGLSNPHTTYPAIEPLSITDSGDDYPYGITMFKISTSVSDPIQDTWSADYGNCLVLNYHTDYRLIQEIKKKEDAKKWIRVWRTDLQAWTSFYEDWNNSTVEYGSNSNGEYFRYPDGRQECYIVDFTLKPASDNVAGNKQETWTFPASFIDDQIVVNHTIVTGFPSTRGNVAALGHLTDSVNLNYYESDNSTVEIKTRAVAIGRWK